MAEYIERDAVIDLFKHMGTPVEMAIKEIPAADVAPVVHAKWKDIEQEEASNLCECLNCGEWVHLYHDFFPDYCPCCGAKMDLEE